MIPLLILVLAAQASPRKDPEAIAELEHQMVELINVEREARGIAPLEPSPKLTEVARRYSQRMAETDRVDHELDRTMEERIREALPNTCMFGENVSKHTSVHYSLADLMTSEGHRENVLNPDYTTIGVGIARGEDEYLYITQEFARPCPPRRRR